MRRIRTSLRVSSCIFFVFFLTAVIAAASGQEQSSVLKQTPAAPRETASAQPVAEHYAELPLSFEANQGQTDGQVRFLSHGTGYSFYLTPDGATLTFAPAAQSGETSFQMQLAGANAHARIQGLEELPGKTNYFLGSDSHHWFTGIPTYSKVAYENIYPGISLVYYGNQRQLEYDFVVSPGANPQQIRLSVSGAQNLSVDAQGNLVLGSSSGNVQLLAPKVYQQVHGRKQQISGQWNLLANNIAGFRLGTYDRSQPLVIDPVLMYSSFLGGSQKNSLAKIAIDKAGNAYVAGYTNSGDFPAAPTPMAMTFGNGKVSRGAFVAKIDPTGKSMLYSTYLSGGSDEEATGLAIDGAGNVYVAGTTHSTDFPTVNAMQASCATHTQGSACSSAFLTKIAASGSSLIFSTYLGGSGEESARSLTVDAKGSAYVVGTTSSPDFPVTAGAAQAKCAGTCQQNAFLAKFDPSGSALTYATYLGGSSIDDVADVALDASNNVYVTGKTTSPDFPTITPFQKSCTADSTSSSGACLATAFLTKVKADGSAFVYSTYLGGSLGSQASAIAVDKLGAAYVTGSTQSADFPVLKAYQKSCALDKVSGSCSVDAFLTKFSPTGQTLVYSTYVGGSGDDEASGIAVDASNQAHLIGTTTSSDFPTVSPVQKALKGTSDAFVVQFNATGTKLNFSTYHGGSATESAAGIALDATGNIYLTGQTTSTDFPTHDAFQTSCAGSCASSFVTKMDGPRPQSPSDLSFNSPDNATFTVGTAGTFTVNVTSTGTDQITLSQSGTMDTNGVITFTDNAIAPPTPPQVNTDTATIAGTPTAGDGGTYTFTVTAGDASGTLNQTFTLTINEAAATPIGPGSMGCTVGIACTANNYTATGFPAPTMNVTGTLPNGVSPTPGPGTLSLGGTPLQCSGGVYHNVAITATNGVGTDPTPLPVDPITIDEAPTITSTNSANFKVGTLGSFTVTACAYPAPTFTVPPGSLPTGVTLSGAGVLSGTPAAGTAGRYTFTITAHNTQTPDGTQLFQLDVEGPPSIAKAFSPNSIALNTNSTLTFTITNPAANPDPLAGVAFTDTLPAGLVVATPNGLTNSCGGTATATAGSTSISLTGGGIAVAGSCTVVVNVKGAAAGSFTNTSGAVSSTNGGTGNTAIDTLTVVAPPSIAKAFVPSTIQSNANSTLTFTLTNPAANTVAEAGVAFTDALPAGLVIATPNGLTDNCGGTATATAGSTSISLTGGTIAVNTSCTVVVSITSTTAGSYNNTSGAVSSTNGGTGNTATASLTVVTPPSIAKAFSPTAILLNGSSTLTFTITNPAGNTVTQTGVAFSDTLPAGLVVATPNGLVDNCSGSASATAGGTSISLTGGSVAANSSCTVVVNIKGTAAGTFTNTSGAVSSTQGGTGNTATATLTVVSALSIAKAFSPTTILLNATSALTFTITNPAGNTVAQTGVAFSDSLPAGLLVATPNGLTNSCGGTASAAPGGTSISLTGGSIAVNSSCTVVVNITDTTAGGSFTNTSGAVSSTNGGTGNTATAALTVNETPNITSVASTTFTVGASGSFTVTATGFPVPTFIITGSLPSGVTFNTNTGVLSGTPATGTGGPYSITFKATNSVGTTAGQSFMLTVDEAPSFTSSNSLNCQVLVSCPFTVTTNATAFPIPALAETATLPSNLTFTDNGDRTGKLAGSPAQGTGGVYSLNFKATNTAGTANQPFALTIADFSPSVSGSPVTIIQGSSGVVTLIETGQNGYAGTITPSCPAGSLCNFTPATVTLPNAPPNNATQLTIGTTGTTVVGPYMVNVISTDANGDTHTVQNVPFNVECTYALSNPTLTPLNGSAANPFPFGFTVAETAGGTACPFGASGSGAVSLQGGSNNSITGNASGAVNFQLATPASAAVISPINVSFFAAAPATGTLTFSAVQEGVITPAPIVGGQQSLVPLPTSGTWSAGSTVQYSAACGVVGPQGTLDPTGNFGITCSVSGSNLTISTISTTSALLRPRDSRPLMPAYLFALLMPAVVFVGGTATLGAWRKRVNRSRMLTFLGIFLLTLLSATVVGCATGGIHGTIGQIENPNNFTITVLGTVTDSTGAVEGVEIQTISQSVTPNI